MKRDREIQCTEFFVIHCPHEILSGCIHRSVDLQRPGDLMGKFLVHVRRDTDQDFLAKCRDLLILVFVGFRQDRDLTVLRVSGQDRIQLFVRIG